MATYLARPCPQCNGYLGIILRESGRNVPVRAVSRPLPASACPLVLSPASLRWPSPGRLYRDLRAPEDNRGVLVDELIDPANFHYPRPSKLSFCPTRRGRSNSIIASGRSSGGRTWPINLDWRHSSAI